MVLGHNVNEISRTRDVQISQDVTFESMLLAANTLHGLRNSGFYKPSPVQLHGIPLGKCGFDLLLEAKSGTGKTAVFSVIALEKLDLDKGLQVVIMAPTREIAYQICDVIKQIGGSYKDLVVEVVMGGLPVVEDIAKFKKNVHIVVGSPGRLRHLIQDKHIDVSFVRLLILDEADKLMEKSFLADINYIFSILPNQKQVIMSSATYPESTKTFINKYVKCAQHVCPDSNYILLGVEQKITIVKSHTNIVRQTQYRFEELLKILSRKQFKQCLIFCNYQARVNELYKLLTREKWPVEQLCGQQVQSDRLDALKTLQEYKCRILISTDLAARGIDASNVDLVINFEPPFEWQTYLHRIGRAGRYGSYGMAITILGEGKEENTYQKILEAIKLDALKVTPFWKSQNDENTSVTPQLETPKNNLVDITSSVQYKELWETLVSDCEQKHEIVDFEGLCKSFEESKASPIESFTDLINSFKNDNLLIKDDSIYQQMTIDPKIMNNVFPSMKSFEINIKETKDLFKDNNDNDISNATNKFKQLQVKENTNIVDHQQSLSKDEFKNKDDSNSSIRNCDEIGEGSSSKALLDAGLPLSFGSSKKFSAKKAYKVDQYKKTNRKSIKRDCNESTNNYKVRSNDTKYSNTGGHIREDDFSKSQSKNEPSFLKKRTANNRKQSENNMNKMPADSDNYNQSYINWYKQLKIRVKYFELAVYVDEISRL